MALEELDEETRPLGLIVSGLQTVPAFGEDNEITRSFTYLSSVVLDDVVSYQEVTQRIGLDHGAMDSLTTSIWRKKVRTFQLLVSPVLHFGC